MIPPGPRLGADVPDDPDVLAAEYVIGALTAEEGLTFEAHMRGNAGLRASVEFWRVRLAPLADLVPAASPPPELWKRLALAAGLQAATPVVAVQRPRKPKHGVLWRAWQNLPFWRGMAVAGVAVAAGLGMVLVAPAEPVTEPMLAALSPSGTPGAMFLLRVEGSGVATLTTVGTLNVPAGRSLQLWTLAPGTQAPLPLGVVPPSGRARLRVASPPGTRILVSQEPFGGSPTGKPTGPVVFAGQLLGS